MAEQLPQDEDALRRRRGPTMQAVQEWRARMHHGEAWEDWERERRRRVS